MKSLCLPTHDSTQRCTHGAHSSPNNGFGMFVFHYNITRKGGERRNGKTRRRRGGGEERCSKSQEGGIYVDGGRNTPPNPYPPSPLFFFFITEGKQGPPQSRPHHHERGVLGMRRRMEKENTEGRLVAHRKTRKGGKKRKRKFICVNMYLKAPQGPSMSFPQYRWMRVQSLENLMERERDTELALCVCVCEAAAVRPSITAVKSMPNEDADDGAHTHTRKRTQRGLTEAGFLHP